MFKYSSDSHLNDSSDMRQIVISTILSFISLSASGAGDSLCVAGIGQGADLSSFVWQTDDPTFRPDSLLEFFRAEPLSDATFSRMQGRSYPQGCPIRRSELRYLILPHYDGHGHVRVGEMVCNRAIADDLVAVFRQLYLERYPIERMVLIDEYDGDDEASMRDNNTSCFNYRTIGSSRRLSRHAYGMAVDINPLYNPYVRTIGGRTLVTPEGAEPYADRSRNDIPYKITLNDRAYRLLRARGFRWGGSWRTRKDYQHFQK